MTTGGRIILGLSNPALDPDGNPIPESKLTFYEVDTTTKQDIFADYLLTTPLSNPLIADGAGRFVEAWGDITKPYDVQWADANGALIWTFTRIVPLLGGIAPDGTGVDAAQFRTALGLGTAAVEDTGDSGHTVPFLDGINTWSSVNDFTAGLRKNGEGVGLRRLVPATHDADYTFVLSDRDTQVKHTSATPHAWTIPLNADAAFDPGDAIYLRNTGTGGITLTRTAGVKLRILGVGTDANVAFASWGGAVLSYEGSNEWVVMGAGLS